MRFILSATAGVQCRGSEPTILDAPSRFYSLLQEKLVNFGTDSYS